jgi:hypothetical protein
MERTVAKKIVRNSQNNVFITVKEVKRIVSLHFKEKYKMEVDPDDMKWKYDEQVIDGLEIGGDIVGENGSDSDTD